MKLSITNAFVSHHGILMVICVHYIFNKYTRYLNIVLNCVYLMHVNRLCTRIIRSLINKKMSFLYSLG